jgi:hypothetical protein
VVRQDGPLPGSYRPADEGRHRRAMMEDGAMEAFGGFDIKHPDCVFIDGTWQRPVQGGTIDVV